MDNDTKSKYSKGDVVYYQSSFDVKKGVYVSQGGTFHYVEDGDGVVVGVSEKSLFTSEADALREVLKQVKDGVYSRAKILTEKIEIPTLDKLTELLKFVESTSKEIVEILSKIKKI